jgi:hypothetical protein
MTRMGLSGYGLCRTPDGRTVPCDPPPGNQPLGNGLAQLALMLRGSGWLDQADATRRDERSNAFRSPPANSSGPAYGNSWAAMPDNFGRSGSDHHLPITKAQEIILPSMAEPWIETFPMYEPRPAWELPPMPQEISPFPFEAPNLLKGQRGLREPDDPNDPECEKEREAAKIFCAELISKLGQGVGPTGFGVVYEQCLRGQVSERCGGNPVEKAPRRKVRPYRPLQA